MTVEQLRMFCHIYPPDAVVWVEIDGVERETDLTIGYESPGHKVVLKTKPTANEIELEEAKPKPAG